MEYREEEKEDEEEDSSLEEEILKRLELKKRNMELI